MGVSGERVVPTMAARLQSVLSDANNKYDWIVILGGMCADVICIYVKLAPISAG